MASLKIRGSWRGCQLNRPFSTSSFLREDADSKNAKATLSKTPIATDLGGISLSPRNKRRGQRIESPYNERSKAPSVYPVKPIRTGEFRDGTVSLELAQIRASEEAQSHPKLKPKPTLKDTGQRKASLKPVERVVSQSEGVAQASKQPPETTSKKPPARMTAQADLDKPTTEDSAKESEETEPTKKERDPEELISMDLDWMSSDTVAVGDRKWLECLSWQNHLGLVEHEGNYYFRHQIWVMANKRLRDMALERVLWEDRQQRIQRLKAKEPSSEASTSDAEQHTEQSEGELSSEARTSDAEQHTEQSEEELTSEEKTPEIVRLVNKVLDPKNIDEFIHNLPEMYLDGTLEGIDKFMSLKEALTVLRPKLPEPKPRLTTLNPDSDWTVLYGGIPSNRSISKKLKQIGGDYSKYFDWDIAEAQKYQELPISLYANFALRKNPQFNPHSKNLATYCIWEFAKGHESLLAGKQAISGEKDVQN